MQPWTFRRWTMGNTEPWKDLASAWKLSLASARVAWMRGMDHPDDLAWRLDPQWARTLEPYGLLGMGQATARIRESIQRGEGICVYGDYDVDGVTATAIMVRALERLGAKVDFFIPNRFNDGYGLHLECLRELAARGKFGLVVSVDCGIRSLEEAKACRELGLDLIITDHHLPGEELPEACAVLHPWLGQKANPYLSGAGVAFKLAQALLDAVPVPSGADAAFLDGLLKLVAIGTIADMVPLGGENALLVKRGLNAMNGPNGPGLEALLRAARVEGQVRSEHIAFGLGPRLNAVGRMGGAEDAVRLLLTRDPSEAALLIKRVEGLNEERKAIQKELSQKLAAPGPEAFDLVVDEQAHKGVLGIVAGQRMRQYGIPSAVCTVSGGLAQCSLRAPEGYDLAELLALARPFLSGGGGHRQAAGMSFEISRLPFVQETLRRGSERQRKSLGIVPFQVDGTQWDEVPGGGDLLALEPFGQGFPEVVIVREGRLAEAPTVFGQGHLRFRLEGISSQITWFFAEDQTRELKAGLGIKLALSPQDHPKWGRSWRVSAALGNCMHAEERA